MSKIQDEFREHLWCANGTEYVRQAGTAKVYVSYRPGTTGRASQSPAWQVVGIGFKTDPEAHWRDYGHKTFGIYGIVRENKPEELARALAWAEERYGITEWEKSPWGDYVAKGTNAVMKDRLKQAKANPGLKVYHVHVDPQTWADRGERDPLDPRRLTKAIVVARSREDAVRYLAETGATVDPKDLDLAHPDGLVGKVEGQVNAELKRYEWATLRP